MKTFLFFILTGFTLVLGAHKAKRAAYDLPDAIGLLLAPLRTTFVCDRDGYFADQDNNCQIFHVCHTVTYPDDRTETFQYSFICGNLTIFNQRTFTCTYPEDAVPCERAHEYYSLNDAIGDPNANFQGGTGGGGNSGRGGSSAYGNAGANRAGGAGNAGTGGRPGQSGAGLTGNPRLGGNAGIRGQSGIGGPGGNSFGGNSGSRQGGGVGGPGGNSFGGNSGSRQGGGVGGPGGGGVGGFGGPGGSGFNGNSRQGGGVGRFGGSGQGQGFGRGGSGLGGGVDSFGAGPGGAGLYGRGQGGGNNPLGGQNPDGPDGIALTRLKQAVKKQIETAIKESDKEFKNLEKQIDIFIETDNRPELRKLRVKVLRYKEKVRDLIIQIRSLDWEDDEVVTLRIGAESLDNRADELIIKIDNHLNS